MDKNLQRVRTLTDDPLQQLLILVGLYIELFELLKSPYPGCLLASYVYELQNFDESTVAIINEEFQHSRQQISLLLEQAVNRHQPATEIEVQALADAFMVCFEGAFILSKSFADAKITAQQLRLYRKTIELHFRD
jgi:TetR/AcrR family transcriptional repressor of nem operon